MQKVTFPPKHAPAHRARQTSAPRETPEFISPDMWPANSSDLNPVDYRIWGVMQEQVYKTAIRDVVELRQRLVETWHEFQQTMVDDAIDQWWTRLVQADGSHIEQHLWRCLQAHFSTHPTTVSFQSHSLFLEENSINFDYKNNTERKYSEENREQIR